MLKHDLHGHIFITENVVCIGKTERRTEIFYDEALTLFRILFKSFYIKFQQVFDLLKKSNKLKLEQFSF